MEASKIYVRNLNHMIFVLILPLFLIRTSLSQEHLKPQPIPTNLQLRAKCQWLEASQPQVSCKDFHEL